MTAEINYHNNSIPNKVILMKSSEIICIATFIAAADQIENLQHSLLALIEPSREESGCISYNLHQAHDNEAQFTMIEKFKDQAAFDFHSAQPYLQALVAKLNTLVEHLDVKTFSAIA